MSWKLGLKFPLKNQDVFWTIPFGGWVLEGGPGLRKGKRTLRQLLAKQGLTYWEVNGYFLPASQKVRISAAPRIHCAPNAF